MKSFNSHLPGLLREHNILLPIKVDITHAGARFVDTFSWGLNSLITPEEFSVQTVLDLNLPNGFQSKISLQISEQVEAFKTIISLVSMALFDSNSYLAKKLREPQLIAVGIRHHTIDYSDKFTWNLMSNIVTPEQFAAVTVSDLGLPLEMEPVIAHKIRETIFRLLILWVEESCHEQSSSFQSVPNPALLQPSEIRLSLVSSAQSIEMISNLWKRAKPSSLDEQATIPQPLLPTLDKDTNASVWLMT